MLASFTPCGNRLCMFWVDLAFLRPRLVKEVFPSLLSLAPWIFCAWYSV